MQKRRFLSSKSWQCLVLIIVSLLNLPAFAHNLSDPVPANLWGMHVDNLNLVGYGNGVYPPPYITFKTLRLHDGGVSWADVEPQRGVFDFSRLDKYVAIAQSQHLDLIYDFYNTPTWASSNPTLVGAEGLGGSAPPAGIQDYVDYVTAVVTRYKGQIKYYEGWNEANDGWNVTEDPNYVPPSHRFFTGTPHQLLQLQSVNADVVRTIDRQAVLLSPAFVGAPDAVQTFLTVGAGKYYDIQAYHFYVSPGPPEAIAQVAVTIRQTMNNFGYSQRPLWNTETGWLSPNPFPQDKGAAYVARSYIIAWSNGIDRFCWYCWNFGLGGLGFQFLDLNNPINPQVVMPAGLAYRRIQDWLIGKRIVSLTGAANGIWKASLVDQRGAQQSIVWSGNDTDTTYQIGARTKVLQAVDINGTTISIPANGVIQVGANPILIY